MKEDPVHVFIETALIAFVVYLLVFKEINKTAGGGKKGSSSSNAEVNLSEAEKEELIRDWKPSPLVPPTKQLEEAEESNAVVVHQVDGTYLIIQDNASTSSNGASAQPQARRVLNMASNDFLGMGSSEPTLKQAAQTTLTTYGCGSCGPRGFYGTIDVHLDLERKIAEFCHTDDAIMYSDGASAATSTVAAFAKRGDLLVVDEGIYEALQTGVTLSRANVVYFKHNDMVCNIDRIVVCVLFSEHVKFDLWSAVAHFTVAVCFKLILQKYSFRMTYAVSFNKFVKQMPKLDVSQPISDASLSWKVYTKTMAMFVP